MVTQQRCGAAEIKTIIVIRCFAQSRQQQTDRMKDPFNPLLRIVSESGARHERIWGETRPNLGRGTTAPGTRHDRIWEEARLNAGRRSLTGIGCGLAGCLVCKPIVFAKSGRLPHHSLIVNTPKYSIAFHILQYGLHGMLTVFLLIKHQNQCCQISKQIISASRTIYHKKALTLWQNIKL